MDKIALAVLFLVLGVSFLAASVYVAESAYPNPVPQLALQLLALGVLFFCLFAIFLWWGITELKVELAKLQLKVR